MEGITGDIIHKTSIYFVDIQSTRRISTMSISIRSTRSNWTSLIPHCQSPLPALGRINQPAFCLVSTIEPSLFGSNGATKDAVVEWSSSARATPLDSSLTADVSPCTNDDVTRVALVAPPTPPGHVKWAHGKPKKSFKPLHIISKTHDALQCLQSVAKSLRATLACIIDAIMMP